MGKSAYSETVADEICALLERGMSLREVCQNENLPDERTVRRWASDPKHPFAPQYARAREVGYAKIADEILDIADDARNDWMERRGQSVVDKEAVDRSKLRVETRKWLLSKMLPKVYGEKVTNEITGALAVTDTVDRPPAETREEWIARRKRELANGAAVGTAARTANGRHNS